MRTRRIVSLTGIAFMLVALTGCRKASAPAPSPQPSTAPSLVIGALLPLTGPTAFLGTEEKRGLEAVKRLLAEERARPFELRYEDTKNEAKTAVSAFTKIWQVDRLRATVVTHSGVNGPISDYLRTRGTGQAEQAPPLILATIVSSEKITEGNGVIYRLYPSGKDEAQAMANFAARELGVRKAAVLYQNDEYGLDGLQQFTSELARAGGTVVFSDSFLMEGGNNKALIFRCLAKKPEAVHVVGSSPAYATVIKELRNLNYKGRILTQGALELKNIRETVGAEGLNGIYYTTTFATVSSLTTDPRYARFAQILQDLGGQPNLLNVFPAAALEVLLQALPSDGSATVPGSFEGRRFKTILGEVSFAARNARLAVHLKRAVELDPTKDELLDSQEGATQARTARAGK